MSPPAWSCCLVPCWKGQVSQGKGKLLAQRWGLSPELTLQPVCYISWKKQKALAQLDLGQGQKQQDGWFRLKTNLLLSLAMKG